MATELFAEPLGNGRLNEASSFPCASAVYQWAEEKIMVSKNHTPLPWHLGVDGTSIYGPDNFEVADPGQGPHCAQSYLEGDNEAHWSTMPGGHVEITEQQEAANAAFIVTACNAHYKLLAAAEHLARQPCTTEGLEDLEAGCCASCRARDALAKVKEAAL